MFNTRILASFITRAMLFVTLAMLLSVFYGCKDEDKDTTPPVIEIIGNNPATACVGFDYVDQGATATDETDGDLTSQIHADVQVDTSQEGPGYVNYEVSDAAGNKATATRVVTVIFCK